MALAIAKKIVQPKKVKAPKIVKPKKVKEQPPLKPPPVSTAIVVLDVDQQLSAVSPKRSQQDRRDLDGQVRRIIEDKLKHIDKVLLSTKTSKSG